MERVVQRVSRPACLKDICLHTENTRTYDSDAIERLKAGCLCRGVERNGLQVAMAGAVVKRILTFLLS